MLGELPGLLIVTTPGVRQFSADPDRSWIEALHSAAMMPGLAPLHNVVTKAAADAFSNPATLADEMRVPTDEARASALRLAAHLADEIGSDDPKSSFVLAWLALTGWIFGAEEAGVQLRGKQIADTGWRLFPQVAASASMRFGGLHTAMRLVELASEALRVADRRSRQPFSTQVHADAVTRCNQLAQELAIGYELAIRNLADDLRSACQPGDANLRAEVAALLWTLGRTPESFAVLRGDQASLTRALARRVVRESIQALPEDPLVQYLWLELKNRPEVALREHRALFSVINHRWDQWVADSYLPESPSRVYAQTLVALLSDQLDPAAGERYLQLFDLLSSLDLPSPFAQGVPVRLRGLQFMVAVRLDLLEPNNDLLIRYLESQVDVICDRSQIAWRRPDLPRVGTRLSGPLFELLDRSLGSDHDAPADPVVGLVALERVRASGLTYWLRAAPPLTTEEVNIKATALLEEEEHLITLMRGKFFLMQKPSLPPQFQWADLTYPLTDTDREAFYSPKLASDALDLIEARLDEIATELDHLSPGSGAARGPTPVSPGSLVEVLGAHAKRPQ